MKQPNKTSRKPQETDSKIMFMILKIKNKSLTKPNLKLNKHQEIKNK